MNQVVEWANQLLCPPFDFHGAIEDLFALLSESLEGMLIKVKHGMVMMASDLMERIQERLAEKLSGVQKGAAVREVCARLDQLVSLCNGTIEHIKPLLPVIDKASDVMLQLGGEKKDRDLAKAEVSLKQKILLGQKLVVKSLLKNVGGDLRKQTLAKDTVLGALQKFEGLEEAAASKAVSAIMDLEPVKELQKGAIKVAKVLVTVR
jgi:hypothetical protein